ncbi:MAG: diphthamide biosynthesis enzyme Dph2 [Candidatus Aenigmatarchaeota archaeon]
MNKAEAFALLKKYHAENKHGLLEHTLAVARYARNVAELLRLRKVSVDAEKVEIAAVLHDIGKGYPRHEAAGAQILRKHGLDMFAKVVETHGCAPAYMDNLETSLETKIINYADGHFDHDKYVTLDQRIELLEKRWTAEDVVILHKAKVHVQKGHNDIEEMLGDSKNILELVELVLQKNPKNILLQLPDGLKKYSTMITDALERSSVETIISAEPCYGACCLATDKNVELVVHVGHNEFGFESLKSDKVLFYPWKLELEFDLDKINFGSIKEKNISLVSTIQYIDELPKIKGKLEKDGKRVKIVGQILGCRVPQIKDTALFVGSGMFHPTGINGNVYRLDVESGKVEKIDTMLIEKKRQAAISKLDDAKTVGILVSTKPGQYKMGEALKLKDVLEKGDKKCYIVIFDEINANTLAGVPVDAFINTACPRIVEDKFDKPMINFADIEK